MEFRRVLFRSPILVLGFYKIASSLMYSLDKQNPLMKDKMVVVDFNPEVYQALNKRGIKCKFGDIGNTSTILEAGLEKAKLVVSTIPDTILKGTNNMNILTYTKRVNPGARVVVTAENIKAAQQLWAAGADFVVLPHFEASEKLAPILQRLLTEENIHAISLEYQRMHMEHKEGLIE